MNTIIMKPKKVGRHTALTAGVSEEDRQTPEVGHQTDNGRAHLSPPDPEVPEQKTRRNFTAGYKLCILQQADSCDSPGQIGQLLRREGLYSSNLTTWRKQRDQGLLHAMTPKKRGRKRKEKNPLAVRVSHLEKENQRLELKLKRAELIIDAQKKISEILGITQNLDKNEGGDS